MEAVVDLPDLPAELTKSLLTEAQSEDVVELYQAADTKDVGTPGGVVSDSVQVYWTNQGGPSVATGMVLGTASGNLTTQKMSSFGIAARAVPSWRRSEAATRSAILFSTGSAVPCHALAMPWPSISVLQSCRRSMPCPSSGVVMPRS